MHLPHTFRNIRRATCLTALAAGLSAFFANSTYAQSDAEMLQKMTDSGMLTHQEAVDTAKLMSAISAPKAEKYATTALAGKDAAGDIAVLINLFDANADKLVIDFKNTKADISKARIFVCDETKKLENADGAKAENGKITIPVKSQYSTVLIKLK